MGLDVTATALLNDLYQGVELDNKRQQQLISLFKLRFDNPQDMRADVQGKPVYLGLAMNEQGFAQGPSKPALRRSLIPQASGSLLRSTLRANSRRRISSSLIAGV